MTSTTLDRLAATVLSGIATVRDQMNALLVRRDPQIPHRSRRRPDAPARDALDKVLLQIHIAFIRTALDDDTIDQAIAVNDAFFDHCRDAGIADLDQADAAAIAFVQAATTLQAWHLRKNSLLALHNTLRGYGTYHRDDSPLVGLRPPAHLTAATTTVTTDVTTGGTDDAKASTPDDGRAERPSTTAGKPVNRIATNDEILLARVSARIDCTGDLHRRAAALAIATNGATTGEGAQVSWNDHTKPVDHYATVLHLPGRHLDNPDNKWHRSPRTVRLDEWSTTALNAWHAEATAGPRPVAPNWSIVYDGRQSLTGQSAKNCFDHQLRLTLDAADLGWIPELTTLSLSDWAGAHTTVHREGGLDAGAAVMGVDQAECLIQVRRARHGTRIRPSR